MLTNCFGEDKGQKFYMVYSYDSSGNFVGKPGDGQYEINMGYLSLYCYTKYDGTIGNGIARRILECKAYEILYTLDDDTTIDRRPMFDGQ